MPVGVPDRRRRRRRRRGDELAEHLGDRLVAALGRSRPARPRELAERARGAATASGADVLVCDRRRIIDRTGQGDRPDPSPADRRRADDVRGERADDDLRAHRRPHKQTGKDPVVLPQAVIYDPELTARPPRAVTGPSAFNALAHAVEALYAPGHNPVTSALALEGVRAIRRSLPRRDGQPDDLDARSRPAVRRLPVGHGARCHGGRPAPQALPRPRRHVQPRPRRHPQRGAPPRRRLQRARAAGGDGHAGRCPRVPATATPPARCGTSPSPATSRRPSPISASRRDELTEAAERAAVEITDNPRPCSAADLLALLQRAFAGGRPDHQQRQGGAPR